MFIKFADAQVTGQGRGMSCPCKKVASQHVDIEHQLCATDSGNKDL
jgi:hypothetical protein